MLERLSLNRGVVEFNSQPETGRAHNASCGDETHLSLVRITRSSSSQCKLLQTPDC